MKALTISVVVLVAVLVANPARATGWYSTQIAQIEYDSTGSLNVYTSATNECGSTRALYVTANDTIGRAILSMLLAWQAQGMGVNIYVSSCSGTIAIFTAVYNQ